jgi:hypothetical protein
MALIRQALCHRAERWFTFSTRDQKLMRAFTRLLSICADELMALLKADVDKFGLVVKFANIKGE